LDGFKAPGLQIQLNELKKCNFEQICLIDKQENDFRGLNNKFDELKIEYELNLENFMKKINTKYDLIDEIQNENLNLIEKYKQFENENLKLKQKIDLNKFKLKEKLIEIEKLLNFNKNSINEVNSLKIALDIKNGDLS
jgi:hypothetical protein